MMWRAGSQLERMLIAIKTGKLALAGKLVAALY